MMPDLGVEARGHRVHLRHRLRRPLPVLHEHLRDALRSTAGRRRSPPASPWPAPDLDIWVVSGDGDALSIGGNHLIHLLRRNVNLTMLIFNNQIYGLTKGQYSPTSEVGQGHQVHAVRQPRPPVQPGVARPRRRGVSFVARTHDMDRAHMIETMRRAHDHKGAAVVEIFQNCNVFNDGAFEAVTGKEDRTDMLIPLRHGEPIRFGADLEQVRRRRARRPRPRGHDGGRGGGGAHPRARRVPHRPRAGLRPVAPVAGPDGADADRRVPSRRAGRVRRRRPTSSSTPQWRRRAPATSPPSCAAAPPGTSALTRAQSSRDAEDDAGPGLGPEEGGLGRHPVAGVGDLLDLLDGHRPEQDAGVGPALGHGTLDVGDAVLVGEVVLGQRGERLVEADGVERAVVDRGARGRTSPPGSRARCRPGSSSWTGVGRRRSSPRAAARSAPSGRPGEEPVDRLHGELVARPARRRGTGWPPRPGASAPPRRGRRGRSRSGGGRRR